MRQDRRGACGRVGAAEVVCVVERKDRRLPRFMVVPASRLEAWKLDGTTVVDTTVNGFTVGRRSLKRWDDGRWFIELTQPMCLGAGVDTGDRVTLSLRLATDDLPQELAALLARSRRAEAIWLKLTPTQQRLLREDVLAAKSTETRQRRVERAFGKPNAQCGEA